MAEIVTIAGSPSAGSRSAAVLAYARRLLERHELRTAAITVRDLPPEDLIYGRADSPAIQAQVALLREARAVIVATPVYKASLSGVLKSFLDLLPPRLLSGKVVLPLATGGSPLHALAADYALLPVLAALGAQHTLNSVYLIDSQIRFDEVGLSLDAPVAERLDGALHDLLEALSVAPLGETAALHGGRT